MSKFRKIIDAIDELKEFFTSVENSDEKITSVDKKIKGLGESNEVIKTRLRKIEEQVQELRDSALQEMESRLLEHLGKVEDLNGEISKQNNELSTQKERNRQIERELNSTNADLAAARSEITELQKKLEQELADKNRTINDLTQQLRDKEQELADNNQKWQAEVANLKRQYADENDKMTQEVTKLTAYVEKNVDIANSWNEVAEPYAELYDAFVACDSLRGWLEENNISGSHEECLMKLASRIGYKNIDLAKTLYDYVREKKKAAKSPMTVKEAEVYDKVNTCYRKTCGIAFEIFTIPGNTSILDAVERRPFNKDMMEDITDPRSKLFRYANGFYVPAVMSEATGNKMKACIVEAGNR